MSTQSDDEARSALNKAAEAMRQQNKAEAFSWASRAARICPDLEEPWLIMAAVSDPYASLQYLNQALQINPQSEKAKKGIIWATKRLELINPQFGQTMRIQAAQPHPANPPAENTQQIRTRPSPKQKNTPING